MAFGDEQRNPLALPSQITRGPGPQACLAPVAPAAESVTPVLRVNGLPANGQIWMVQIQGSSTPPVRLAVPAIGSVVDAIKGTSARISWQTGNSSQQIEADLPAAGLAFPLLCESVTVEIIRRDVGGAVISYAAALSIANGSSSLARLTRTVEVSAADLTAGTPQAIPRKATAVQFTFNTFAVPATRLVLIDFQDSTGGKVGATGVQDSSPPTLLLLPQAAARFVAQITVGVSEPFVCVFTINP